MSSAFTFLLTILCWVSYLHPAYMQSSPYHSWTKTELDSFLQLIRFDKSLDAGTKSRMADSAFHVSKALKLPCEQIESRILQSFSLDEQGLADSALTQLLWVSGALSQPCDEELTWRFYSSLTYVYLTLGEYERVDSIATLCQERWKDTPSDDDLKFSILTNAGIAVAQIGEVGRATSIFHKILREAKMVGNENYIQKSFINLSSIKGIAEDIDSAFYFLEQAAENLIAINEMDAFMALQLNLSIMDMDKGRYADAEMRLDSVDRLALKFNNLRMRVNVLSNRAFLAEYRKQFEKGYGYLREYITLQDSILNQDRVKAVTEMMEKYESEKKARQIEQLKVENLDATLRNERVKNARNSYLFIGAGILLLAIGLYSRLHYTHKAKVAIQKEKDISEGLLLNILPSSVADELKAKGYADAKLFDEATILFSDFKNFTEIAGTLGPDELVKELNVCFKAFDEIMEKNGLEKIKTIGDAYMAAGSLPETSISKAVHVIHAALDMQQFIETRKLERERDGLHGFEMRVGVNSGPVVAGIVGVKKFQYDLWGDTVNIASRMETNGEPGRVNISESTYQLVKSESEFRFSSRGMVYVKGKGDLAMYFADRQETA